jgi:hypothetical protein
MTPNGKLNATPRCAGSRRSTKGRLRGEGYEHEHDDETRIERKMRRGGSRKFKRAASSLKWINAPTP